MRRQARFGGGELKRKPSEDQPRPRFKIICEGKVTEALYFDGLRKEYNVNVYLLKQTGTPATIADAIIKEKTSDRPRKNQDSWAKENLYWAVFDRDEHPYIPETLDKLRANSVGVGFSNPCFELWLILHHDDHDRPDHRHDVQKRYETLDPSYLRSSGKAADVSGLLQYVEHAEARAKRLNERRRREDDTEGNPSTTVGDLTIALRQARRA